VDTRTLNLLIEVRDAARTGRAKDLRRQSGLAQAELGDFCGVSAATISRWENGSRVPRGEAALRYARALLQLQAKVLGQ